jgi:hypothetical protein
VSFIIEIEIISTDIKNKKRLRLAHTILTSSKGDKIMSPQSRHRAYQRHRKFSELGEILLRVEKQRGIREPRELLERGKQRKIENVIFQMILINFNSTLD